MEPTQPTDLKKAASTFRGEIAEFGAGRQILLEDSAGNVIELFQYADKPASA